ncbi:TPA: hypothetical protein ACPZMC_002835 [Yersinia enterocolitica]|uniref:hypothetical protein n=1 Tax=Yersinia enterocolitica TaxID=630 RepID=UPI000AE45D51|nr:hypothetical protein [Yersinia enterocolitica]EKN4042619.1 hypothetical protein [Yersinia enterocolitica]EKN4828576.1 hypothetical protein [Yersinia enterocolitica]EKN4851291.1 hypothetical protein [Yersinia enterocolitica]ELW7400543.1 hypothetical protein [Yersinia enterocolitica]ELW8175233.1 hypothetical protein [Yersinia enterocolitica]
MVIDHIQEKIIGSDFFKVWVMSLHCAVPLGEFKGTAGTVFFVMQPGVLPALRVQVITVSAVPSPGG